MRRLCHERYGITWQKSGYPVVEELLLRALIPVTVHAKGRLLDVGCGAKPYLPIFAPRTDCYIGVDLPTSPHDHTKIDIYASALHLPFQSNVFDTLLCIEVLEHLPNPLQALGEFGRVLKTDGIVIVTCPQTFQLHEAPLDFYRFTRFGLNYLLSQFDDLQITLIVPIGGTLDFGIYFVSSVMLGILHRLLSVGASRRIVSTFQKSYLQLVGAGRQGSEWFCFGHLLVARKVAPA